LEKANQTPTNMIHLVVKRFDISDQSESVGHEELTLDFARGSNRDLNEPRHVGSRPSSRVFSDVRTDRYHRSSNLRSEFKAFGRGKSRRLVVDLDHQGNARVPNLELLEILSAYYVLRDTYND
jgi:hypothetical protein